MQRSSGSGPVATGAFELRPEWYPSAALAALLVEISRLSVVNEPWLDTQFVSAQAALVLV
jgi:hypothetical protein